MPVKNGFETLQSIHEDATLNQIPVLILSNLSQETDMQKLKELGARDYLVKSDISLMEAITKIKQHLGVVPDAK